MLITDSPQEAIPDNAIVNNGFFPAVDLAAFRDKNKIDSTITAPRLRTEVIEAMINVNQQLATFKADAIADGKATLSAVEAEQINDTSVHEYRYLRAVGCITKASLIERYRDYDSTNKGDKNADDKEESVDDLRRDAYWAIADILGKPRTDVELI